MKHGDRTSDPQILGVPTRSHRQAGPVSLLTHGIGRSEARRPPLSAGPLGPIKRGRGFVIALNV